MTLSGGILAGYQDGMYVSAAGFEDTFYDDPKTHPEKEADDPITHQGGRTGPVSQADTFPPRSTHVIHAHVSRAAAEGGTEKLRGKSLAWPSRTRDSVRTSAWNLPHTPRHTHIRPIFVAPSSLGRLRLGASLLLRGVV